MSIAGHTNAVSQKTLYLIQIVYEMGLLEAVSDAGSVSEQR